MSYWTLEIFRPGCIEARHRWLMPSIDCRVCRHVWFRIGYALPSVSLEGNPADWRLQQRPYPVPFETWLEFAEVIRPAVPASEPILPGMNLGPLQGRSHARFRVTWNTIFGIVLSEEVREEFAALAPGVPLVRANLTGDNLPPTYEIEFRSYGAELIEETADHCDTCGYYKTISPVDPKDYRIRNIPDAPLFTLRNLGLMIAHDRLLPFFERELGPKLKLTPIQVEM